MPATSRVVLIAGAVVAYWRRRAVDAGEEDGAPFLLFDTVSWYGVVLGCLGQVGGLRCWASTWAAAVQVSFFSSFLFSVFISWFLFYDLNSN
jgi:hypothetical protein